MGCQLRLWRRLPGSPWNPVAVSTIHHRLLYNHWLETQKLRIRTTQRRIRKSQFATVKCIHILHNNNLLLAHKNSHTCHIALVRYKIYYIWNRTTLWLIDFIVLLINLHPLIKYHIKINTLLIHSFSFRNVIHSTAHTLEYMLFYIPHIMCAQVCS